MSRLAKNNPTLALDLLGDPLLELEPTNRRNVKRDKVATVDEHERTQRDFLTQFEIDGLLKAAKASRFGTRDYTMLLLAFRHGLRVSELISVRRADIDLDNTAVNGG